MTRSTRLTISTMTLSQKTRALSLALTASLGLAACSQSEQNSDSSVEQKAMNNTAPLVTEPFDELLEDQSVVVYSSRAEHLIKPLFERFTEQTGINVSYITDSEAALIQRLKAEGERTPADAFLTVDAGNLWFATEEAVLQPFESEIIEQNVPANLRADDNSWAALSIRARTVVYSTERVAPEALSTYEDLASEKWQGRLCLRTSKKVYNQSLVASMIATQGEEATEQTVSGWVNNLATAPTSNDNGAMEAVMAGVCDVAIVNTYYFGRLLAENPELPLALFWPNQQDRGVHINVSGIGITRHADSPELATKLIEWLSSEQAQQDFAGLNKEYPVNVNVQPTEEVAAWGGFKQDALNVEQAGRLQRQAVMLMDRVGYK